ncbi:MAG: SRPBCC family protein [Bacteroidales bacterium]|nr:SRPBCC family protein [Bacteroidales bacterium]
MSTALIIIAALVVLIIILNFAMGKQMVIEHSININKPLAQVFAYLKITTNQDNFSVWNRTDPDRKKELKGTDGTVGFIYKWDSATNKNVGAGEQEIKLIEDGKRIEYELRFFRPMKNVAKSAFITESIDTNQTRVTWGFYSPSKFPMSLMSPILKKMLGKDMITSLVELKKVLEA